MKKVILAIAFLLSGLAASAQVNVNEPEFVGSYCILTSDNTMESLPKENGTIEQHKTKTKSLLGKIGKIADLASSVGGLGMMVGASAGSVSGMVAGVKTAATAASVSNVASSASALAGAAGMDIAFQGKSSRYSFSNNGKDVRLLIKGENNEYDPMDLYRIVRFNVVGKTRRIQRMEFDSSVIGSEAAEKGGYVYFSGHKYGNQSYLLTIPAKELTPGEYGIFYMSLINGAAIPVGTFSIK